MIDHDLNINIGPKFVLNALHPKAFDGKIVIIGIDSNLSFSSKKKKAYKNSNDLRLIIDRILSHTLDQQLKDEKKKKKSKEASDEESNEETKDTSDSFITGIELMTPIKPMLAKAIKSSEEGLKRCPNGMYTEIKYDGERIQIHKKGKEFKFFSRNLKGVLEWKVGFSFKKKKRFWINSKTR